MKTDDEAPGLRATALLAETLIGEGLIDRQILCQRALTLAEGEGLPRSAAAEFRLFAEWLAERRWARILPRSSAPTRRPRP